MYDNQYPPQTPPPGYWQNNPFPPEKPKENPVDLWRIVGLNFGIFALYQTLLVLVGNGGEYLILDMFPLVIHWLVMLIFMIISFSRRKRMAGFGWLISFVVLIIIGFGSCWWISDLLGGGFG